MGSVLTYILGTLGVVSVVVNSLTMPVQKDTVKFTQPYNPEYSLIDYMEDSIGTCDSDYSFGFSGISSSSGSSSDRICLNGTIPDLQKFFDKGYKVLRIDYTPKEDINGKSLNTSTFYFFFEPRTYSNGASVPFQSNNKIYFGTINSVGGDFLSHLNFYTSSVVLDNNGNLPIYTRSNSLSYTYSPSELGFKRQNLGSNTNSNFNFYFNRSSVPLTYRSSNRYDMTGFYIDLDSIQNFNYKIYTNFDMPNYNYNNIVNNLQYSKISTAITKTNSHIFNTDTDISLQPGEYLQLFPKGTNNITSFGGLYTFYSDTAFYYHKASYIDNFYSYSDAHIFSEISYITGGFNWTAWTPTFSQEELNNNVSIQISPVDNRPLKIKLDSRAYYYIKRNENSSDYCLNGVCYSNNYNSLDEITSQISVNVNVITPELDTSDSVIESLPNLVSGFKSSFVFIGSIFTTFFSCLNSELTNYFYILFALGLVILIITIFKN